MDGIAATIWASRTTSHPGENRNGATTSFTTSPAYQIAGSLRQQVDPSVLHGIAEQARPSIRFHLMTWCSCLRARLGIACGVMPHQDISGLAGPSVVACSTSSVSAFVTWSLNVSSLAVAAHRS